MAKHVLIVDDDKDMVSVIGSILEREGYHIEGFTDPRKALDHAKGCQECTVVVSDVRMPTMNGFRFVRTLKDVRKELKVILMSSFDINLQEWRKVMPDTEVDAFLTKPFKSLQLVQAIEKCALRP